MSVLHLYMCLVVQALLALCDELMPSVSCLVVSIDVPSCTISVVCGVVPPLVCFL